MEVLPMNDTLLRDLEEWATRKAIHPEYFACPHYAKCSRSHGNLLAGDSVSMSYIGPRYGEPITSPDVRLVCIGIDHGGGERGAGAADFQERRRVILTFQKGIKLNPHYYGVVKTTAAIFGRHTECMTCAHQKQCQLSKRPGTLCALELVAQPNLVKCANAPDMTSRSTSVMKTNCSNYLLEELELLRPTLVVFHGAKLRVPFGAALRAAGWREPAHSGETTPAMCEITGPSLTFDALYLNHPARGNLDWQWASVVEPALTVLRRKGKIPA
jgi:hypothetical protein